MVAPSKKKYDKETLLKISVAFNRKAEPDLVEFIQSKESRTEYIRQLVRDDFNKVRADANKEKEE